MKAIEIMAINWIIGKTYFLEFWAIVFSAFFFSALNLNWYLFFIGSGITIFLKWYLMNVKEIDLDKGLFTGE